MASDEPQDDSEDVEAHRRHLADEGDEGDDDVEAHRQHGGTGRQHGGV